MITKDVAPVFLPLAQMRTKHSGLSVIEGSYRLPPHCSGAEEFINLVHRGRIRLSQRHKASGYDWRGVVM
jgi:hypothetical protein